MMWPAAWCALLAIHSNPCAAQAEGGDVQGIAAALQNANVKAPDDALGRPRLGDVCDAKQLQDAVGDLDLACCPRGASSCPNGSPSTWWVCPSTYASYGIPNRHTFQPTLYADFNPDPVQMAARRDAPSPSLGSV